MSSKSLLLISGLWLAIGMVGHADSDHDEARRLQELGDILSLEEILQRARSVHPGRIIEVELDKKHGRYIYEIESVGKSGLVWEMRFDAKSGELLSAEKDD